MNFEPQSRSAEYIRAALLQHAADDCRKVVLNTSLTPHWINDDCFWYRRQTRIGDQFRCVNAKLASNQPAFNHEALATALAEATQQIVDADNLPIKKVKISLSPQQVIFTAFEMTWCFDANENLCYLEECQTDSDQRQTSPDGKKAIFVRDYNLWLKNLTTGEERALTHDGEQYNAYASPSMAWGDYYDFFGIQARWSPDSSRILTVQVDNRQVKSIPTIHHVPSDGSLRPMLVESRIALPGDEHVEENRLLVIDVETHITLSANYRQIPTNRTAHGLFSDGLAWWANNSRFAYFVATDRGEKVARLVEFDTDSGTTRVLLEETSETCIYLSPGKMDNALLMPLPGSSELIWYSERNGWGHLYLYDLHTGEIKHQITGGRNSKVFDKIPSADLDGQWLVREILHFDPDRRELFIQTAGRIKTRDPYYLDVCRVNIDTGEMNVMVSEDAECTTLAPRSLQYFLTKLSSPDDLGESSGISPSCNYFVTTVSRADQSPVSWLLDRDGHLILELEKADLFGLPLHWQWPKPEALLAHDGSTPIYGVTFWPSDFSSDKSYPVIDCSLCTGELATVPKGSFTNAPLGGAWYLQAAALAELGFIVVMIDGRGTAYRERAFIDASYGSGLSVNCSKDRVAGIKQLATKYPNMDISRVGILAFNGTVGAIEGLFRHADFYKIGVSHCFWDSRLSPTIQSEYLEGAERQPANEHINLEDLAANLEGKLLLIHGMIDTMNIPAMTFRVVEALQKANKDFDMLMLPNEGKGAHIVSKYAFRRTWDYFVTHLQGEMPPKEFNL